MKPIEQTRFGAHDGNCHAACLASIFEVPLEEVPQATVEELATDESWQLYLERLRRDFLHPRGLHDFAVSAVDGAGNRVKPPGYAILCARSPRTGGWHAVVALDGEVAWDPHPQRAMGVGEWSDWTIFAVLDPVKPLATKPIGKEMEN